LRKVISIGLLLLFVFNLFGYQLVLSVLQTRADKKLETLIDNNAYDEAELTEIRVAMNMPYQQRFTEFERHYGQITIEGKVYTYVKRKVEGDMLVLKCIPDHSTTHLKSIAADITKANSNNSPGENPVKSFAKIFGFECDENRQQHPAARLIQARGSYLPYAESLHKTQFPVPHQPPRAVVS